MALSQTAVQRLTMLATYMDGLHPKWPDKFDMGVWQKERAVCGTRACALGWGATMPEFMALGLRLTTNWRRGLVPRFEGQEMWPAVAKFFDITEPQAETLFSSDLKHTMETPQEWAAHCRTFMRQHAVAAQEFQQFMGKVQEPVKL